MKCNDMKKFLLSTFHLLLWSVSIAQEYVIERRDNYRPDTFTIIPPSSCNGDVSAQCTNMGGKKTRRDCKCACRVKDPTFGFYDKQWKCTEDANVRRHEDCSILLFDEQHDSDDLTTITPNRGLRYYLQDVNFGCDIANSSYSGCDGTWIHLDSSLETRFSLRYHWNGHESTYLYYNTSSLNSNSLNLSGRLIRLGIRCDSQDRLQNCILFKIKGKLKCPISFPTSSSILPSTSTPLPSTTLLSSLRPSTSSPTKLSSTPVLDTVQQTQTSSPSSRVPRVSATLTTPVSVPTSYILPYPESSTSSTSNPVSSKKSTVTSNFRPTLTTTSKMVEDGKKRASQGNDNSGLIAGALAGVIGLAVVIAVIVVLWIRKKRDAVSKTTPVAENAGYGRGVDNSMTLSDHGQRSLDEEEYSYAYANSAPFVKTNKKDVVDNTNNIMQGLDPTCSVANRVYGTTEELNRPASPPHYQAPTYNTLEESEYVKLDKSMNQQPNHCDGPSYDSSPNEPVYAKVDKGRKKGNSDNINEPLYNVLEGSETDHEDTTLEGINHEPPCYHVPKRTYPESAPVYDVLEGPEASVYGYLEGQDPHVYGALNLRENQATFEENQGNDDMVYDSVGDVINDTEDIYQQLNQSGQRDSDVYQALSYPDKTMYLSELNEPHSSA